MLLWLRFSFAAVIGLAACAAARILARCFRRGRFAARAGASRVDASFTSTARD